MIDSLVLWTSVPFGIISTSMSLSRVSSLLGFKDNMTLSVTVRSTVMLSPDEILDPINILKFDITIPTVLLNLMSDLQSCAINKP